MIERVILIGFMCSGKSTVGRLLADELGWELIDFDETIEREQKRSIAEIFRSDGEDAFRRLEADLTKRIENRSRVVLAPGGGWMTQPELLEHVAPRSLTVWLRVSPKTVLERHEGQKGTLRPLLAVMDPLEEVGRLLAAREPYYERADVAIDTEGRDAEDIANEIAARMAS